MGNHKSEDRRRTLDGAGPAATNIIHKERIFPSIVISTGVSILLAVGFNLFDIESHLTLWATAALGLIVCGLIMLSKKFYRVVSHRGVLVGVSVLALLALEVWWGWPRIQSAFRVVTSEVGAGGALVFKCEWYNVTFIDLEILEYSESIDNPVRLQFMVHSVTSEYAHETVRIKGPGKYPLNVAFDYVQVVAGGLVIDVRALDPDSHAPNGWKWPVVQYGCENPDAWGDDIRKVQLSNQVIKATLRFRIDCED